MKDCASCPERADLNPCYRNAKFEDTPCASCRAWMPQDDWRTIQPPAWMMLKMHGLDSQLEDSNEEA